MVEYIRDIYAARRAQQRPVISFELFPPKTPEGERTFFEKSLPALLQFQPDYCSVTYGAGGGTRDKTLMIVDRIQREHRLTAMTHLTCVGAHRDHIGEFLAQAKAMGIKNILALRGDPPGGVGEFQAHEGGFEYAAQLVEYIAQDHGFCAGVAGFPEGHIACKEGKHADWRYLKSKIERGADFVLTQLFFDNADFFEFREHLAGTLGVTVPLVPGIIPISSASQIKKFTALCGARLPAAVLAKLEALGDDDQAVMDFGIEYASRQCADLLAAGVPGLHFYTLNKAGPVSKILAHLRARGFPGQNLFPAGT
jgi:methylenetetrahydrofolate reductase (NADPH)